MWKGVGCGVASKTLLMPHAPLGIQITAQGRTEIPSRKGSGGGRGMTNEQGDGKREEIEEEKRRIIDCHTEFKLFHTQTYCTYKHVDITASNSRHNGGYS